MLTVLVVPTPRVVAIHLTCQCCGDHARYAIAAGCQHYEQHLLAPATRWMDGHLAPRVAAVELLVLDRRQLLTEADL